MYIQTKCIAYCKSHHFKVVWMGFSVFTYMYFSRENIAAWVMCHSSFITASLRVFLNPTPTRVKHPHDFFSFGGGVCAFFLFSFCKSLYLASMSADVNSTMSAVWKVDRTTKHHRPVSAKSEFCCNMYEKHVTFWVHSFKSAFSWKVSSDHGDWELNKIECGFIRLNRELTNWISCQTEMKKCHFLV